MIGVHKMLRKRSQIAIGLLLSILVVLYPSIVLAIEMDSDVAAELAAQYLQGAGKTSAKTSLSIVNQSTITVVSDSTPFLHAQVSGRRHWKMQFSNLEFPTQGTDQEPLTLADVTMLIDSATGALVSLISEPGILGPSEVGEMTVEYAEESLRQDGDEYLSFLPGPPTIGFCDAGLACFKSPFNAKRIEAFPVLLRTGRDTLEVWIINLYGIPPMSPLRGPDPALPLYQRNHIRQIVDAHSGRLLITSTSPQYPLKDEHNPWKSYMDSIARARVDTLDK